MTRLARPLSIGALCLAVLLAGALPAAALDVRTGSKDRVLGALEHQRLTIRLGDGETARGDVLRFREDDDALDLRPRLAQRQVHGLQQVPSMARQELGRGAVAGTNGGYWIDRRSGNPNGLHVQDGRLVGSNASANGGGYRVRSALGISASGRLLLDQVETTMSLTLPDGGQVPIRFANRRVGTASDVVVYDGDLYGDPMHVPADGVLVVAEGLRLRSGGGTVGTVLRLLAPDEDRYLTLERGQTGIVAHRRAEGLEELREVRAGDRISISTRVATTGGTAWPNDLAGALPAGGTLLRDGQIPTLSEWTSEAYSDGHFTNRHPRTAIGRTSGGEVLLVTVDGRREGWSVGVTARELARTLQSLGARDAVNLDGGGSSTMTIGGRVTNRPSEVGRSVASGLFLHTEPPPPPRGLDRACPDGRVQRSGFEDTADSVHRASIDCLAWWGVTHGRTATTYDPGATVTRAQMASFIDRWVSGSAERGSARALPDGGSVDFRDVRAGSTHADAIGRLAAGEIAHGYGDGTFRPNAPVTRDQMASFLRRALAYTADVEPDRGRDTFIDDTGSPHEDSIDRLARIGVASGTGGFDYRPRGPVTRAAMASLVMRAADHLVEQELTRPPS